MIRATIRRLRRLYALLWTTDSLGFLHGETTFLRNADARRSSDLAALRDELGVLREAVASRGSELTVLRDAVTTSLRNAETRRSSELAALRNELGAFREAVASRESELTGLRDAVTTSLQNAEARQSGELAVLRDELGALRAAVATRDSELAVLRDAVTALRERQAELTHALTTVHASSATREELDLLKSSLEVAPELREEFLEWKAHHPVPAQPLVSVCVATYNRAGLLLERCLPSILEQTYERFELIIVGDGCTDETQERLGPDSRPARAVPQLAGPGPLSRRLHAALDGRRNAGAQPGPGPRAWRFRDAPG